LGREETGLTQSSQRKSSEVAEEREQGLGRFPLAGGEFAILACELRA
jgi:hypothetical protein